MRRYLRSALAGSLLFGGVSLVAVIAGALPASAVTAVSLYVTTTGGGSVCSQASPCGSIQAAINTAEGGSYNSDDVTIKVAAGTYYGGDTIAASSLNSLTIAGAGASSTTVNGGGGTTLFTTNNGTVTISGLTITNGCACGWYGGGIANSDANLTVTDSTLTGNSASSGGAIANGITGGGPGLVLHVTDSTLTGNSATTGGAIINYGTTYITDSTLTGNLADDGGAIASTQNSVNVTDSTISGNTASVEGGGIALIAQGIPMASVTDSTVTGNSAPDGGGIMVESGTYGGAVSLGATIAAESTAGGDCNGTITDEGYNIADDSSCGFTATGSVNSSATLDASLGSLANNGGPTQTIALEPGSPAIGQVSDPTLCPVTDQRDVPRSVPCAIGAYDNGVTPVMTPCSSGTVGCSGTVSAPSQEVTVTATKLASTSASIVLAVATQILPCQNFSYLAPVATLTDTGLKSGASVAVTDTVHNLPSKKGIVICYQPLEANPPPPVFLAKCHGAHFVVPCYKSVKEVAGSVEVTLELPAGDPRFHIGAETPSVTSYSPTPAKPGKPLTIKGENLSEVTRVTIGGVLVPITKTAPTSVKVTVPAGAKGGVVVVSSSAGIARGPSVTVSGTRIPLHSSKLKRNEHRRG